MGMFGNRYIINQGEAVIDPYKDSDFSPEFIQQFRESLLSINHESIQLQIVQEGTGAGLKNKSDVKRQCDAASKEIANDIKKNGINSKSISSIMDKFWSNCVFTLDKSTYESILEKDKSFTEAKVKKAIKLTFCCLVVNTICCTVLMIIFGGSVGNYLGGVFVAPVVEENAKQISIKDGITKEFAVVFNAFEYSLYMIQYGAEVGFAKMAKVRVFPVLMHLTTTIIQYITNNTKIHKELGIEDLEKAEKKKRIAFIGHLVGVLIHAAWNAGGAAIVIPDSLLN